MEEITLVKVGGRIVEEDLSLKGLLEGFVEIEGHKVLIHGGGREATRLAERLGLVTQIINGRRVTDLNMLRVAMMVYGGLVNKQIVTILQGLEVNALGLTGSDLGLIRSKKRTVKGIDYGYVGDIEEVNVTILSMLIALGVVPVLAPLTHDGRGMMLNTNADTIASKVAVALTRAFDVTLIYCFEKCGVLRNESDESSLIPHLDRPSFTRYVSEGVITGGMIPKLENALDAIDSGVKKVVITNIYGINGGPGTVIR
ncbi:MAG: acetylglutamate kinase [Tannerellaceae bacterium]|jgi:acetylglutamate kinase|nr:acetylglutamate kinase [Tannerellaceae bacterium]